MQQCAEVFGITVEDLWSASRKIQPLFARHACAYLLKTQYGFSITQIAACIHRRQRGDGIKCAPASASFVGYEPVF
jgi:chromosomal replication initiation ATPase DnaA